MAQRDLLKRYLDAGMAFTSMTKSRAEGIVRELARAGEIQRDQVQTQVDELIERSRRNTDHLIALVRKEVSSQLADLSTTLRDEVRALERRLGGAGATVTETPAPEAEKAAGKKAPTKKRVPAKKAAAKKAPAEPVGAETGAGKRAPAKKAPAERAAEAQVAPAAEAPVKKAPAKSAPVKKAQAKRAAAKRATAKNAPAAPAPAAEAPGSGDRGSDAS